MWALLRSETSTIMATQQRCHCNKTIIPLIFLANRFSLQGNGCDMSLFGTSQCATCPGLITTGVALAY